MYFVQLQSGAIKIGSSKNLEQRFSALASRYGEKPTVLHLMEGDVWTERAIHQRFSHLRFKGTEQFRPGDDLMGFIGRPPLADQDPHSVEATKVEMRGRVRTHCRLSPDTMTWLDNVRIKRRLSSISDAIDWAVRELVAREARRIGRLRARKGAGP